MLLQTIEGKYGLHFDVFSVQRVFRLAGTVSKKNEETLSQEILVGLCWFNIPWISGGGVHLRLILEAGQMLLILALSRLRSSRLTFYVHKL